MDGRGDRVQRKHVGASGAESGGVHLPGSPMALSTCACAERAEMRCCCSRKRATSTIELKERLRIRSAQSQVRAQAASTSSSRGAGVTSGPTSGCSGEEQAPSHTTQPGPSQIL